MSATERNGARRHPSDDIVVRVPDELPTLTPEASRILLQIINKLYEQRASERDAQAGEGLEAEKAGEPSFAVDGGEPTGGG